MSTPRKLILVFVAFSVALAGIYVPFEVVDRGTHIAAGYGWVFAPPDPVALINIRQVIAEWLGVLLIGAILWLAAIPSARTLKSMQDHPIEPKREGLSHPQLIKHPDEFHSVPTEDPGANVAASSEVERESRSRTPGIGRTYAAGFIVVACIAVGSLTWREVSRAAPPVSLADSCDFAAKSAMVEQWILADNTIDPLKAAQTVFGPNAKRRWTVVEATELGDKANALRRFVSENARAQAAVHIWLEAIHAASDQELLQRDHVRRLLVNHCTYG